MKALTPKVIQESFYTKYSQLSEECNNKPEKLRALLKQLNDEVGTYLSKKKPNKKQIQFPSKDVLQKEQMNNIEILKRLKFQIHQQQKRLTILEQKTMKIDLENKISQCEDNIKMLAQQIETQKKITQRQGKEITQIEEQHGVSALQNEIRQIDKSIQESQLKNYQLYELIENEQKKLQQFQEYQSKVRDKVIFKEQQSAAILEQDPQIEQQYFKIQLQIQNQERHKKILDEKYLADLKLFKQDINHKSKQLVELENCISKIHLEIIQINEQCQRFKEFQMKRSSQIRQRIKKSQYLNQQSFQGQEDDQSDHNLQILSKSFTSPQQIDNSVQINQETDYEQKNQKKFSTILEDLNDGKLEQNIPNQENSNEDTIQIKNETKNEETNNQAEIQDQEILEKQQESQKLEQQSQSG
ncbi:unnamed protein product [Paramecium primaurelia]|uniref:Uncharacterized protein n=1 Tax=Paramecium primaurelia TaxID=5886 RepID=A0A8S1JWB3_PARPR|nr:unnamed protein product [Paramecium primaurelia]